MTVNLGEGWIFLSDIPSLVRWRTGTSSKKKTGARTLLSANFRAFFESGQECPRSGLARVLRGKDDHCEDVGQHPDDEEGAGASALFWIEEVKRQSRGRKQQVSDSPFPVDFKSDDNEPEICGRRSPRNHSGGCPKGGEIKSIHLIIF